MGGRAMTVGGGVMGGAGQHTQQTNKQTNKTNTNRAEGGGGEGGREGAATLTQTIRIKLQIIQNYDKIYPKLKNNKIIRVGSK